MLVEGSGPPSGAEPDEDRKKRSRPAGGSGTAGTRLQAYTAQPSDVPPTVTTTTVDSSGAEVEAAAPATNTSGYTLTPAATSGFTLASGAGGSEPAVREVKKVQEVEQEAKTYRARRTDQLSWDEYLGLTDQQRAAVDFNTMLVKARQKDLRRQDDYKPTEQQQQVYDKAVERMFGEQGVSETFAPETVALLNDINFKATDAKRFDDLDDFLGLASAISAKDLDKMAEAPLNLNITQGAEAATGAAAGAVGAASTPNPTVATVGAQLAEGTMDLTESLTKGKQVLENWRQVGAGALNESLGYFGGIPNRLASPDIRLGDRDDEYFQAAYDALADATGDPAVLEIIREDLGTEERMNKFLRYADTKSKYSQEHGVQLGGNPAVQYRTPDEFRTLLGLGAKKGGETGATG